MLQGCICFIHAGGSLFSITLVTTYVFITSLNRPTLCSAMAFARPAHGTNSTKDMSGDTAVRYVFCSVRPGVTGDKTDTSAIATTSLDPRQFPITQFKPDINPRVKLCPLLCRFV